MPPSRIVFAAKVLCLVVLSACLCVMGMFVLMAESGGKEPRPDLLPPLIAAMLVIAFGVRRETHSPGVVTVLLALSGMLGWAPALFPGPLDWPVKTGICWWTLLLTSAGAAWLSRRGPGSPREEKQEDSPQATKRG